MLHVAYLCRPFVLHYGGVSPGQWYWECRNMQETDCRQLEVASKINYIYWFHVLNTR